jgi:MYXO-CTERM domain-containing protein
MAQPAAEQWLPVEAQEPLIVPLPQPAPAKRRRTGLVVTTVVVALLLVGSGAAYVLLYSPYRLGGEEPLTEEDLRSALTELQALAATDTPSDAWGLQGTFKFAPGADAPAVNLEIRMLWNPAQQAYLVKVEAAGEFASLSFEKKQKGSVINYVSSSGALLGRDEKPSTLGGFERTEDPEDAFPLESLVVERTELVTLRGRDATHFIGRNGTEPAEVWVFHDTRQVGKVKVQTEMGQAEVDVLRGAEVVIEVDATLTRRASFELKHEPRYEASVSAGWAWINGTISAEHTEEVKLIEVEMRVVGDAGTPVASLRLDRGSANAGNYTLSYQDRDGDGLVSAGDRYSFRHPYEESVELKFFDLWANAYEGGPQTPGFAPWAAVAAVALLALWRRRRE